MSLQTSLTPDSKIFALTVVRNSPFSYKLKMHVLGKIWENLLSFFIQRVKGMLPIVFFSENVDEIVNSHSFGGEIYVGLSTT